MIVAGSAGRSRLGDCTIGKLAAQFRRWQGARFRQVEQRGARLRQHILDGVELR